MWLICSGTCTLWHMRRQSQGPCDRRDVTIISGLCQLWVDNHSMVVIMWIVEKQVCDIDFDMHMCDVTDMRLSIRHVSNMRWRSHSGCNRCQGNLPHVLRQKWGHRCNVTDMMWQLCMMTQRRWQSQGHSDSSDVTHRSSVCENPHAGCDYVRWHTRGLCLMWYDTVMCDDRYDVTLHKAHDKCEVTITLLVWQMSCDTDMCVETNRWQPQAWCDRYVTRACYDTDEVTITWAWWQFGCDTHKWCVTAVWCQPLAGCDHVRWHTSGLCLMCYDTLMWWDTYDMTL